MLAKKSLELVVSFGDKKQKAGLTVTDATSKITMYDFFFGKTRGLPDQCASNIEIALL